MILYPQNSSEFKNFAIDVYKQTIEKIYTLESLAEI